MWQKQGGGEGKLVLYRLSKIRDCSIAGENSWNFYFSMKNQRARRRLLINSLTKGVLDFGKEEADQQLKCWDELHICIVWQLCIIFKSFFHQLYFVVAKAAIATNDFCILVNCLANRSLGRLYYKKKCKNLCVRRMKDSTKELNMLYTCLRWKRESHNTVLKVLSISAKSLWANGMK